MPQVIFTQGATEGLRRCLPFLAKENREAAHRAARRIEQHFAKLEHAPEIGRPLGHQPEHRELVIGFGSAGYIALYRYIPGEQVVYILAFRHQREAGI